MALTAGGLAKLIEECGELIQVCGKKLAYYHTDNHPDGKGPLKQRMEEEMADVLAAINTVGMSFSVDWDFIGLRMREKETTFMNWQLDDTRGLEGVDQRPAPPILTPHRPEDLQIFKDGTDWCALAGMNLQEGIAGFGSTIEEALQNFDKEYAAQ